MPEELSRPQEGAEEALEVLRRHYFRLHIGVQSVCSLLFVTGSTLMLAESTKPAAPWAFLGGSLCFAMLPVVRLLHEKGQQALSRR